MADTIERLYKLTVDGTQAARQLAEIERNTASLDKRMADAINGVTKFAKVLGTAFSVGQVVSAIQRNIDAMDELAKAVQKVGIGAEDLQRLRYAADLSGVSAEQLDKAVHSLAVGMSDLAKGTSETSAALRAIGAKGGESPVETLKRIADQFQKMPDGLAKTNLAITLFGKKVGPDLIPMLNAGGAALQELANEADRFGGVVSQKAIDGAEAFNDNMSRLQRTMAGVTKQMTAGMLPALQTISQSLVDSATKGDGFVSTGEAIGEMLINLYDFALRAASTLQAFGLIVGAVAAAVANPTLAGTIFSEVIDDVNRLEAETNVKLAKLREDFKKFNAEVAPKAKPKDTTDPLEAARKAAEAAKAAKEAEKKATKELEEQERRRMAGAKILIEIENDEARVREDLANQTARYARELEELIRTLDPAGAAADEFATKLEQIDELFFSGKINGEQYDRMVAQLTGTFGKTEEGPKKLLTELDILGQGFEDFFKNMANGAADFEDVLKRTVQSILAQLLKLWAQKAILALFGFDMGWGPKAGATGFAFNAKGAIPFARGGVISSPVTFPMALAGEAGPEAIMPLRRTASGDLGVQAQQAPLHITINNNAPGVAVDTRTTPEGLEVIITQVRDALTADVLRGGNDFARANERAWGLSRGSAAAF